MLHLVIVNINVTLSLWSLTSSVKPLLAVGTTLAKVPSLGLDAYKLSGTEPIKLCSSVHGHMHLWGFKYMLPNTNGSPHRIFFFFFFINSKKKKNENFFSFDNEVHSRQGIIQTILKCKHWIIILRECNQIIFLQKGVVNPCTVRDHRQILLVHILRGFFPFTRNLLFVAKVTCGNNFLFY